MELPKYFHDMPVVWLSLGNQIIIIGLFCIDSLHSYHYLLIDYRMKLSLYYLVLISILNLFVYKRFRDSGRSFSIKKRIIFGLISAVVAMLIAGTVELVRLHISETDNFTQTIGRFFRMTKEQRDFVLF